MIVFLAGLAGGLLGAVTVELRVIVRQHKLICHLEEHWVPGPALVAAALTASGEAGQ